VSQILANTDRDVGDAQGRGMQRGLPCRNCVGPIPSSRPRCKQAKERQQQPCPAKRSRSAARRAAAAGSRAAAATVASGGEQGGRPALLPLFRGLLVFPSTARTPNKGRGFYPISTPYNAVRIPRYYPYLTRLTTRTSPVRSTMRSLSSDWDLYATVNTTRSSPTRCRLAHQGT